MILSQAEENYLKELYHLSEDGSSVSTNALAFGMSTTPASVNDMLKRLSQKGLLNHVKYKGATITDQGKRTAIAIIRKHRLWEVFLVEKLNFQWDEVHEIAEQLEHIHSPRLTDRLDAFLDFPKFDPHGDPIPDADGNFSISIQYALSELQVGDAGLIVGVGADDPKLLQHLDNKGIRLGLDIEVLAINEFDESLEVRSSEIGVQFISSKVADLLLVSKNESK